METGETITAHNERTKAIPNKYDPVYLGLDYRDRQVLYARIDQRVDEMAAAGLWDEVQALLASGVPEKATALQAIGYKEPMAALRGEITRQEAIEEIKRSSRRYAKRQLTWFRRNEKTRWFYQEENQDFSSIFAWARREIPFFDKAP